MLTAPVLKSSLGPKPPGVRDDQRADRALADQRQQPRLHVGHVAVHLGEAGAFGRGDVGVDDAGILGRHQLGLEGEEQGRPRRRGTGRRPTTGISGFLSTRSSQRA